MLEKGFTVPALLDPALPAGFSWWPSAPGWTWLATLLLLLAAGMAIARLAHWRRNRWRREAQSQLNTLQDADAWLSLIKQISLVHRPRKEVAQAVTPDALLQAVPLDETSRTLLCERYCRPDNRLTPEQNARLAAQLATWLETLPHV
ncbi:DUF4381 domain-containing protein [Aeromonas veronii]|uniref:DUF4381 domain-containing protein n=1 Tax=Aeromonas veronii TaxID=654 RepID=UPI0032EACAEB